MIRVALVDDQPLVRAGLARILSPADGFEVVAECADGAPGGRAAARPAPRRRADGHPHAGRSTASPRRAQLRARRGAAPVLVLTTFDDDEVLWGAIEAGAAGFVLKDASAEDLIAAARAVAGGGAWFDPAVAPRVLEPVPPARRAARPREAARLERSPSASTTCCRLMARGATQPRDRRHARTSARRRSRPTSAHLRQARRPRPRRGDRVRLRPRRRRARPSRR